MKLGNAVKEIKPEVSNGFKSSRVEYDVIWTSKKTPINGDIDEEDEVYMSSIGLPRANKSQFSKSRDDSFNKIDEEDILKRSGMSRGRELQNSQLSKSREESKNKRIKDEIKELFVSDDKEKADQKYNLKFNLEKRDNSQLDNTKSESPIIEISNSNTPIKKTTDKEVQVTDDILDYLSPRQDKEEDSDKSRNKVTKARLSKAGLNKAVEKTNELGIDKNIRLEGEKKSTDVCNTLLSELNLCYISSKPPIDTYNFESEQYRSNVSNNPEDAKYKIINKYIDVKNEGSSYTGENKFTNLQDREQKDPNLQSEPRYKNNLSFKGERENNRSEHPEPKNYTSFKDHRENSRFEQPEPKSYTSFKDHTENNRLKHQEFNNYSLFNKSNEEEFESTRYNKRNNIPGKTERKAINSNIRDNYNESDINKYSTNAFSHYKHLSNRGEFSQFKPYYENKLEMNYSQDNIMYNNNYQKSDGFDKFYNTKASIKRQINNYNPDKYSTSTQQSFFKKAKHYNGHKVITPISEEAIETRERQERKDRDHSNISIRDTSKGRDIYDKWTRIINKYRDRYLSWKDLSLDILKVLHESIFHKTTNPGKMVKFH
jgi:hypothetical protein